jgi:hypothetical protein
LYLDREEAMHPAGAPSAPIGGDYTSTIVSHFRAGNELWDREAGGVPRTVARVETIIRIHFDPMPGQPDHRDYNPFSPTESRQWGRKGVPVGADRSHANLEDSWERAAEQEDARGR